MEQTRNEKYRASMIKNYGSESNWRIAMREYGSRADKTTPRGFKVMDKEKHSEISKKGAKAKWDKYREQQEALEKEIANDEFLPKI